MNLMVLIILTESLKIGFDRLILQKEMMFCWSPKIYVDLSKPGILNI